MATVLLSDIISDVINLLGTDAQLSSSEVATLAIARYAVLHDANPWSKRRKNFALNMVASSSNAATDTLTVTLGSSTATSAGTPFTSANSHDKSIRIGGEVSYFTASFNTSSSLSLTDGNGNLVTWARTTATAATWTLFQTLYALPSDCDLVMSLASNYPLAELDGGREALDRIDPNRQSQASDPTSWVYAGINTSSVRLIEVWPVPSAGKTLRGQYMTEAPRITSTSTIQVHQSALTYAVAADAYNLLHSKTGDQSYKDMGLFYEKKYAETKNDLIPYEVARNSPPTSIGRQRRSWGRGTDRENSVDMDLLDSGHL